MTRSALRVSQLRVGFQVVLHVVIVLHVVGYYFFGQTAVGGVDFQDFFFSFLGQGVVTVAVLFTASMYLISLVFGRLFCSWGCHFAGTQDLAAWVLRRLGWRPPHIETRFLHWAPYLVLGFIFLWPSLARWLDRGWQLQGFDFAGGGPWERLPGTFMSVLTLAMCSGGILLFLGRRGFCRFVCPYGAIFRVTGRVAPFRVTRVATCDGQAADASVPACTRACPTAIDVHSETTRHGHVRSLDCVQCHLCIEACPEQALGYTARRPVRPEPAPDASESPGLLELPVLGAAEATGRPGSSGASRYSMTVGEEVSVMATAIVCFLAVDLVYGGHFLAATLAFAEAFLFLVVVRLLRGRDVSVGRLALRQRGQWQLGAVTVVGVFLISLVPIYHAGSFKILHHRAAALWSQIEDAGEEGAPQGREETLSEVVRRARRALWHVPSSIETRQLLCNALVGLGRGPEAIAEAEEITRRKDHDLESLVGLSRVYTRFGKIESARLVNEQIEVLRSGE